MKDKYKSLVILGILMVLNIIAIVICYHKYCEYKNTYDAYISSEDSTTDTFNYYDSLEADSIKGRQDVSDFINNVSSLYGYSFVQISNVRESNDDNTVNGMLIFDNDAYASFWITDDKFYAMLYVDDEYIGDSDTINELTNAE
jgi:hypothetical protein